MGTEKSAPPSIQLDENGQPFVMVGPRKLELFGSLLTLIKAGDSERVERVVASFIHDQQFGFLDYFDEEGNTILHWLAFTHMTDPLKLCLLAMRGLKRRVDILSLDQGRTPCMWAALAGHVDIICLLESEGADLSLEDSMGYSMAHLAVQTNQSSALLYLSKKMPQLLSRTDRLGCTLLHWAAFKNAIFLVRLLIYLGVDLRVKDKEGKTALHRAAIGGHLDMCIHLMGLGLNPYDQDFEKWSVTQYMQEHAPIAPIFEHHVRLTQRKVQKKLKLQSQPRDPEFGLTSDWPAVLNEAPPVLEWGPFLYVLGVVFVYLFSFGLYFSEMRHHVWRMSALYAPFYELIIGGSFALYCWTAFSNPGMVKKRARGDSAVEEVQDLLVKSGGSADVVPENLCYTCWIYKDAEVRHVALIDQCVPGLDHYCVWLGTAIGLKNHRRFVVFLVFLVAANLLSAFNFCWVALETFEAQRFPEGLLVCFGHFICELLILSFTITLLQYQLRLIAHGMTTVVDVKRDRDLRIVSASKVDHCLRFWRLSEGVPRMFNPDLLVQHWRKRLW
jgi:palmitoyltransferase